MTRCDEYLYDRPAVAHHAGQFQTVHASGHLMSVNNTVILEQDSNMAIA
jgi:hypothetical protein